MNSVPSPIVYTSGSETSVQVPDSLIAWPFDPTASIVVQTPGQSSQAFSAVLAPSAPGLFTANSSGSGQLASLNQNGAENTATNAATAGTNVTVFATGAGTTNPQSVDGAIQNPVAAIPSLPVKLTIGGQNAQIVSAGTPVGTLSGIMAVTAVVPSGLTPGPVPVVLTVGTVSTTQNVTIAVK
jgi:uncharacterized protein (TIGR03437 family)